MLGFTKKKGMKRIYDFENKGIDGALGILGTVTEGNITLRKGHFRTVGREEELPVFGRMRRNAHLRISITNQP